MSAHRTAHGRAWHDLSKLMKGFNCLFTRASHSQRLNDHFSALALFIRWFYCWKLIGSVGWPCAVANRRFCWFMKTAKVTQHVIKRYWIAHFFFSLWQTTAQRAARADEKSLFGICKQTCLCHFGFREKFIE